MLIIMWRVKYIVIVWMAYNNSRRIGTGMHSHKTDCKSKILFSTLLPDRFTKTLIRVYYVQVLNLELLELES